MPLSVHAAEESVMDMRPVISSPVSTLFRATWLKAEAVVPAQPRMTQFEKGIHPISAAENGFDIYIYIYLCVRHALIFPLPSRIVSVASKKGGASRRRTKATCCRDPAPSSRKADT